MRIVEFFEEFWEIVYYKLPHSYGRIPFHHSVEKTIEQYKAWIIFEEGMTDTVYEPV